MMATILTPLAPIVASLLREEFASIGPPVTDHLPVQSWHQWGRAVDVFCTVGGKALWDGSLVKPIANIAEEIGLFHGYKRKDWDPKRRHWHVQLDSKESPFLIRGFLDSWPQAEAEMLLRFDL